MSTDKYATFHRMRMGQHLYPTEFLVRTMIGKYPNLSFEPHYEGARLLDLGFGDGRNFPLFANLGLKIYGVEPDAYVCDMVSRRAEDFGIRCTLLPGTNSRIPFAEAYFDFVVASHSIYYVEPGKTFNDNLDEAKRVLRESGWLIVTVPDLENYILTDAIHLPNGHFTITKDPYGIRNGSVFRAFVSATEIREVFEASFHRLSIARFDDDWYGVRVSGFVVVCQRRERQSDTVSS